jgi:hypothetical protein
MSLTRWMPSQNEAQHDTNQLMQNQQAEVNLKSDNFHHITLGKYGNSKIYCCQTATLFTSPWFNKTSCLPKILSSFNSFNCPFINKFIFGQFLILSQQWFKACMTQERSYSWGNCGSHTWRNPCSMGCKNTNNTWNEKEMLALSKQGKWNGRGCKKRNTGMVIVGDSMDSILLLQDGD